MEFIEIRKEIRKFLAEIVNRSGKSVYSSGDSNTFPTAGEHIVSPTDLDRNSESYLMDFGDYSKNNDFSEFPLEKFKKGLSIERARMNKFNIIDISISVLERLKDNPNFYSELES